MLRNIKRFIIHILCLIVCALSNINAKINIRTSVTRPIIGEFYIAVDFKVSLGEHATAPIGKGKPLAPSVIVHNCEILKSYWAKAETIIDHEGRLTEYKGFTKDFTVTYKCKVIDINKPINYDIFYATCGKSCIPHQYTGVLEFNGLLSQNELNNYFGNKTNILYTIFIGFLGGFILNFMPCVFPMISIKLLSIVKLSGQNLSVIRRQSLLYSFGTIFTFVLLGSILCLFRLNNPSLGWGFYMQNPVFNFSLLLVFLLCALHFLSVYQIHIFIPQFFLFKLKNIYIKSILNGVLGAITSTVCAGPFLSIAIGSTVLNSDYVYSMLLFLSISIGLTIPFIIVSIFPKCINKFPKISGNTLQIFTIFLGILMLLSCAWIFSVLCDQIKESLNIMLLLSSIVLISGGLYISKLFINKAKIIAYCGVVVSTMLGYSVANNKYNISDKIEWEAPIENIVNKYDQSHPMFLNFTASWCLNCQFNQRLFSDKDIVKLFRDKNIKAIKCDWTSHDSRITELLSKYGSLSVPFYVYYPGNNSEYIILPSILTKNILKEVISNDK